MSANLPPVKQTSFYYFDNNATTPVCDEVLHFLPSLIQSWGNPSSIHWAGRGPKTLIRDARKNIAESINSSTLEIIFTSGGSEANSTVVLGVFTQWLKKQNEGFSGVIRNHYMCSAVEHPSMMKAMLNLRSLGAEVDIIPVNREGQIDLEFLKSHLSERTALVSVMIANNETGTIFPIQEIAELVHKHGALFHADAVQAYGKIHLDMQKNTIDLASFSAHKVNAIKGTGFIYSRKGTNFEPLILGGGQERHRRGGTENVWGIAALGIAVKRFADFDKFKAEQAEIKSMRDHFEKRVINEIAMVSITSVESERLANTSSLILQGCDGETLLMSLDIKGYAVSTGAACSSGNPEPSPVLLAMGLRREEAQNSLRVSINRTTKMSEIDGFIEVLKLVVTRLRSIDAEVENV